MKNHIIHLLIMLTSIGSVVSIALSAVHPTGSPGITQNDSPFACNVNALTPTERKRHFEELGPLLRSMKKGVRELKNGYEFQFAADQKTFQLVSEWAMQESFCCPFFQIELRLESEGGPFWLKLTGRKGTKEFIQSDAPDWIKK